MSFLTQESYSAFGGRLVRSAFRTRTPVAGSLALTHRCNLDCVHCYLQESRDRAERPAGFWFSVLDQIHDAGCLWLTLTGGEPLLHGDFPAIYDYARSKGFLVTVFTNATRIGDDLLDLFGRRPPFAVEITLYGHSPATYASVTGQAQACAAVYHNLERLLGRGIPVQLKTVVLRQNLDELAAIQRTAARLDLPFRFDTLVTPCLDGSAHPCSARIDEEIILDLDLLDEKRRNAWMDCLRDDQRRPRQSQFSCGAGMTSFHVHPDGQLSLCLSDVPLVDLDRSAFLEGWRGAVRERREAPLDAGHPCSGCRDLVFCGVCPPLARMETGSEEGLPVELCRIGRRRRHLIQTHAGAALGRGGAIGGADERRQAQEGL